MGYFAILTPDGRELARFDTEQEAYEATYTGYYPDFVEVAWIETFDPDNDPYAVVLSPADPERAYDYTVTDVLLDLRNDLTAERDRLNRSDDARIGILRALYMLDYRLSQVTGNRISLDSLPPVD